MIKNDYGHLNCPYFVEKLPSGVMIYLVPRKSNINRATILISKGSNQSDNNALGKIPFGAAYYLSNLIFDNELKTRLAKENIMAESEVTASYTTYSLSSIEKSLLPYLSDVMKRISNPFYSEKDVERFKEYDQDRIDKDEKNPLLLTQMACVKGLYITSSIQQGVKPDRNQANSIHATGLRKFQESYYVPKRTVLILSGDFDPKTVLSALKGLPYPKALSVKEPITENKEIYDKVFEDYLEVETNTPCTYLTYGIKFPSRKDLYDAFGESLFYYYEILIDLLFKKNPSFLSGIADLRSELVYASLNEAGEDTCLLLTFRSENGQELCNYLAKYLSKAEKKITNSLYDRVQKEYYAKSLSSLSSPYLLIDEFARSYPNHISYPSLVSHTMRLSYSTFRKFLDQLKKFPRACAVARKA